MIKHRYLTGFSKYLLFIFIFFHVSLRYIYIIKNPRAYTTFLIRVLRLLRVLFHHKAVQSSKKYKIHLYLPAYPTEAFFHSLESKLLRTPPGPTTAVFSITKACTYQCPHCYQQLDSNIETPEPRLIEAIQKARDKGVSMFNIEGGDPFLKFERLNNLLTEMDSRSEIWINSTGANVDESKLLMLKELGLYGLMISIHSPYLAQHDEFTGVPGSFNIACKVAQMCRKLGLAVVLNSVLSEKEIRKGYLCTLMNLARDLDTDYVQLIHPKPAGKWMHNKKEMQNEEALLELINEEHQRYNSRSTRHYPSLAAQVTEEATKNFGCTAGGVDRLYINASGEMQPCEFLNISFGNITEESFEIVLDRMRNHFQKPCTKWLCCTQAESIAALMKKNEITQTPIPWRYTKEIVSIWNRGEQTKIYKDLGIYN